MDPDIKSKGKNSALSFSIVYLTEQFKFVEFCEDGGQECVHVIEEEHHRILQALQEAQEA